MLPFYVIGHKNPDTDAICSAIGYAALLRAVGEEPKAIAARCGEISSRTKWVLERAGLISRGRDAQRRPRRPRRRLPARPR